MALENLIGGVLCAAAQLITGVRAVWRGCEPEPRPRVYFANHRSHGDFLLIWSALPQGLRRRTRPVAGADYWLAGAFRRYVAQRVFRGVLIERTPDRHHANPIDLMSDVVAAGESLIVFPEGTRNLGDGLLPLKPGIWHLAKSNPEVEFVPVWIENLGRVMPKGALLPVPLLCTLTFGQPLRFTPGEPKEPFLQRVREALLSLAPSEE